MGRYGMTSTYRLLPVHRYPWLHVEQGYAALAARITRAAAGTSRPWRVAIDGFSGVRWPLLIEGLSAALRAQGGPAPRLYATETCFLEDESLQRMLHPFVTDDPVFGRL